MKVEVMNGTRGKRKNENKKTETRRNKWVTNKKQEQAEKDDE